MKKNIMDHTQAELRELMLGLGEKPYRAEQVFRWVFARGVTDFSAMTDLSKTFRETLASGFCVRGVEVTDVRTSVDGTVKFVSTLADGARVESVVIPEGRRVTLCVSTQAGCAFGCRFCMTGKGGFIRDLELSEMAGQVLASRDILDAAGEGARVTNVVLMGMGEPLSNYDNVIRFVGVLLDPKGFHFSHNKVTVSTVGLVPEIERLGRDTTVNLAVSLNATTDEVRSKLMPINRKYPIATLIEALRRFPTPGHNKHITIEYVLIGGVNDTTDDARRLVKLLRGIDCKVNLIPFNPHPGSDLKPPDERDVAAFHSIVLKSGVTVITRASKGADISAACGQLSGRYTE